MISLQCNDICSIPDNDGFVLSIRDDGDVHNATATPPSLLDSDPLTAVPYVVVMAITMTIGIFGNVLVIASFWKSKRVRIVGNEFILNLAIADLLISLTTTPFLIIGK